MRKVSSYMFLISALALNFLTAMYAVRLFVSFPEIISAVMGYVMAAALFCPVVAGTLLYIAYKLGTIKFGKIKMSKITFYITVGILIAYLACLFTYFVLTGQKSGSEFYVQTFYPALLPLISFALVSTANKI